MTIVVSKENAEHYVWGVSCDGWRLVDRADLSVIHERMPRGSAETRHFHQQARQFFFVLSGELSIEVAGTVCVVAAGRGLEIAPGAPHRVVNAGADVAEFLVVSQPTTRGDRTEG